MRTQVKVGLFVSCLLLAACLLACFQYMRMHSFSAREKPHPVEAFLARNVRRLAVPPGVKELKNPVELTPFVLALARDHFADHCAICHSNRGDGKTLIGEGLYPPPPDMRLADTQNLSDGEIMFIIKNGIRFTGMPGWGGKDEENWRLVWFIRHLPRLSDKEVELMKEINGEQMHFRLDYTF
jgi:hypothetical protein